MFKMLISYDALISCQQPFYKGSYQFFPPGRGVSFTMNESHKLATPTGLHPETHPALRDTGASSWLLCSPPLAQNLCTRSRSWMPGKHGGRARWRN